MTFLLNNATPVQMQGRGAGEEVPTFWQGISAGFSSEYIRTNANAYAQDSGLRVREETARSIQNRLGMGEIVSALQERDDTYGAAPQIENMEDVWGIYGADTADVIFDLARRDAEANPDAWSDVDLSDERIEAQVTERLTQEYRDAQDMLDMMGGGGRMAAEFAGAAGAAFADLRQAILLPFGLGSGSIIKTIGREAALGAAGEAITLPSQYAMAERLGLQDPNVVQQLAFAATIGGAFGGAMEAGGRALTYFLGRQSVPTPSARGEAGEQFIIGAAEDAIARGESPFPATERALAENPPLEYFRAETPEWAAPERFTDFAAPSRDLQSSTAFIPTERATAAPDVRPALESNRLYQAARDADPHTFAIYERLQQRADTFRRWIEDLGGQQRDDMSQAAAAIDARIADLEAQLPRTQGKNAKAQIRNQIKEAKADRAELDRTPARRESRDIAQVRQDLMRTDERMRDLAARIGAAYGEARTRLADAPQVEGPARQPRPEAPFKPAQMFPQPAERSDLQRLAAAAPDGPDFSARSQMDWLDAPSGAKAEPVQAARTGRLRAAVEAGDDPTVILDGKEMRLSEALDELDADDALTEAVTICSMRGGA